MSKQTMQQLTEHFKFSFRHDGVRPSFSLRPILRWPRPSGLDQRRIGADDENIVHIRFYRKKFTLAIVRIREEWLDPSEDGSITYVVQEDRGNGRVLVQALGTGLPLAPTYVYDVTWLHYAGSVSHEVPGS